MAKIARDHDIFGISYDRLVNGDRGHSGKVTIMFQALGK